MAKTKKNSGGKAAGRGAPVKRAYEKRAVSTPIPVPVDDLLQIESSPPPMTRFNNAAHADFIARLKRTVEATVDGQAFIIRVEFRNIAHRWLRENVAESRFIFRTIHGNDEQLRVYRLEWPAKPKKK